MTSKLDGRIKNTIKYEHVANWFSSSTFFFALPLFLALHGNRNSEQRRNKRGNACLIFVWFSLCCSWCWFSSRVAVGFVSHKDQCHRIRKNAMSRLSSIRLVCPSLGRWSCEVQNAVLCFYAFFPLIFTGLFLFYCSGKNHSSSKLNCWHNIVQQECSMCVVQ